MVKRTTIELDQELVEEARVVLAQPTVRATVEEALRRAVKAQKDLNGVRRSEQVAALSALASLIDPVVLASEEAWR